jgi:hypothetical protein
VVKYCAAPRRLSTGRVSQTCVHPLRTLRAAQALQLQSGRLCLVLVLQRVTLADRHGQGKGWLTLAGRAAIAGIRTCSHFDYEPHTCSLGSHIALRDVGAKYELRRIDFGKAEQQSPSYLGVNPKGWVPALVTPRGTSTCAKAVVADRGTN